MGLQNSKGAGLVDAAFDDAQTVTPSDLINAAHRLKDVRGLWSNDGGDVAVITETVAATAERTGVPTTAAAEVIFTLLPGVFLPLRVAYVLAADTAATDVKVFY